MANPTTVTVKILDKEFQVSCGPDEVDALNASARHLDQQMQIIRDGGKVVGLDRIAVMAALNITHEYLVAEDTSERIEALTEKVTNALAEQLDA